jgi:hypothetical protein
MTKVTEIKKVKCSICSGYIKPLKDKDGNIVWEHGNNAEPINDGRCCDDCNWSVVIPERLRISNLS